MVYKAIRKINNKDMKSHRFCDICGDEIDISLVFCTTQCIYCKKDLCEKHIAHEETIYDDSRIVYCNNCWNLGEGYRPEIEELQNRTKQLYKEWQDRCKV